MSECESVRGQWGEICPDCGQRLPVAKPWSEGRPCAKNAFDRGHGWDGTPVDQMAFQTTRTVYGRTARVQPRVIPRQP